MVGTAQERLCPPYGLAPISRREPLTPPSPRIRLRPKAGFGGQESGRGRRGSATPRAQSNKFGVWFTAAPSIASIFSLVTTPPFAEKPPGLLPAASTRWHGTTIGQGLRPSAWPTSRDSSTPPSFLAMSP